MTATEVPANPGELSTQNLQDTAWQGMLIAQLNQIYWTRKTFWLSARLKLFRFVAAIIGCAAFGSLFLDPSFGIWNKLVTLVAAALSIYLTSFDIQGSLVQVEQTRDAYSSLFGKFERLWLDLEAAKVSNIELSERLAALSEEEGKIKTPTVIESKRLRDKAFDEICSARGLKRA